MNRLIWRHCSRGLHFDPRSSQFVYRPARSTLAATAEIFTSRRKDALASLRQRLDMSAAFGIVMRLSILRAAALFFSLPACAFSASNVVNLSHYDMMRPDFAAMKREGI